jgi:hypothetical protein
LAIQGKVKAYRCGLGSFPARTHSFRLLGCPAEVIMEKRYRALRIISTLYKILGIIVLVIAIIGAVGACLGGVLGGASLQNYLGQDVPSLGGVGSVVAGIIGGIIGLIFGGLSGLSLYAVGEGISLLIAMEENTRATAMHLAAQSRPAAPVAPPAPQG